MRCCATELQRRCYYTPLPELVVEKRPGDSKPRENNNEELEGHRPELITEVNTCSFRQ
jgi:hypothetical protein